MDSSSDADSPSPTIRRRNSIATSFVGLPAKLSLPHSSSSSAAEARHSSSFLAQNGVASSHHHHPPPPPSLSFELISLKTSPSQAYISLKDIIPSSPVNSPTAAGGCVVSAGGSYPISIRNRLVKQAAWAYLQPMSASPSSDGPPLLRRLWLRFSAAQSSLVASCLAFLRCRVIPAVSEAINTVLRALHVRTERQR